MSEINKPCPTCERCGKVMIYGAECACPPYPYTAGSQPPEAPEERPAWAAVQRDAGLKEVRCPRCMEWKFPQELSSVRVPLAYWMLCRDCAGGRGETDGGR